MRRILLLLVPLLWLAQAATAEDAGLPQAQIATSLGTITIALDRANAPATVANFIHYAKAGHFDNTLFYRVVPHFVIQAGDIDAKGHALPEYAPIPLESANGLKNVRGSIAMARTDEPNSAGSAFFINLANNRSLNPKPGDAPNTTGYAVFGKVVEGMDVVDAIAAVPIGGGAGPFPEAAPATPVVIDKVTVSDLTP
jgi:peptidyl-prolyl cis-trans isomerase A (cyclophilin A)